MGRSKWYKDNLIRISERNRSPSPDRNRLPCRLRKRNRPLPTQNFRNLLVLTEEEVLPPIKATKSNQIKLPPIKSRKAASEVTKMLAAKVKKKTFLAQKRSFDRRKKILEENAKEETFQRNREQYMERKKCLAEKKEETFQREREKYMKRKKLFAEKQKMPLAKLAVDSNPGFKGTASEVTKKLAAKVKKKAFLAQKRKFEWHQKAVKRNSQRSYSQRSYVGATGNYIKRKRLCKKERIRRAKRGQNSNPYTWYNPNYKQDKSVYEQHKSVYEQCQPSYELCQTDYEGSHYDQQPHQSDSEERQPCLVKMKVQDQNLGKISDENLDEVSDENLGEVSDALLDEVDFEEVEVASIEDVSRNAEIPVGFRKCKKKYLCYKRLSFFRPKIYFISPERTIINCLNFCEQSEEIDIVSESEYEVECEAPKLNSDNVDENETVCPASEEWNKSSEYILDSDQDMITDTNLTNEVIVRSSAGKEKSLISSDWSPKRVKNFHHTIEAFSDSELYQGKSVIQNYLDIWYSHLIGLEYLIEIRNKLDDNSVIKYHCVLCDEDLLSKDGFAETVINHITHHKHSTKYLEKHFPSCGYKFLESVGNNASEFVLQKCCEEINNKFGYNFMCITNYNFYKNHKQELEEHINNAVHFNEVDNHLDFTKFEHHVEASVCKEAFFHSS